MDGTPGCGCFAGRAGGRLRRWRFRRERRRGRCTWCRRMLRALIVDDEPPACRRLAGLLVELGATVAGTAGTAAEALRLLDHVPVDAAFLDVRLPEVDGLVLGDQLRRQGVPVVFVTGFADFALPAFDLGAVDYLLKPVSRDRLGRTLARIAPRPAMTPGIDRLCVREGQDRLLLPLPGVLYLRRDDDVTTVALDQNTLRVREALRQLELVLAPHGFFRCHRAYLVNLRRVRRIVPWSRDAQSLLLDDPKETLIPLAKSRIQELRQLLLRAVPRGASGEMARAGASVMPGAGDVTREEDVRRIVDATLQRFGAIDILVSNAAGPRPGRFLEVDEPAWPGGGGRLLLRPGRLSRGGI